MRVTRHVTENRRSRGDLHIYIYKRKRLYRRFSRRSLEFDNSTLDPRIRGKEKTFASRKPFEEVVNDESQFRNAGTHYGNAESWERDSSKEINGSWFEHGRLRMEGDYKLGLEAKQPKRVHSTRQGIHTYTYIYTRRCSPLIGQTSVIRFAF